MPYKVETYDNAFTLVNEEGLPRTSTFGELILFPTEESAKCAEALVNKYPEAVEPETLPENFDWAMHMQCEKLYNRLHPFQQKFIMENVLRHVSHDYKWRDMSPKGQKTFMNFIDKTDYLDDQVILDNIKIASEKDFWINPLAVLSEPAKKKLLNMFNPHSIVLKPILHGDHSKSVTPLPADSNVLPLAMDSTSVNDSVEGIEEATKPKSKSKKKKKDAPTDDAEIFNREGEIIRPAEDEPLDDDKDSDLKDDEKHLVKNDESNAVFPFTKVAPLNDIKKFEAPDKVPGKSYAEIKPCFPENPTQAPAPLDGEPLTDSIGSLKSKMMPKLREFDQENGNVSQLKEYAAAQFKKLANSIDMGIRDAVASTIANWSVDMMVALKQKSEGLNSHSEKYISRLLSFLGGQDNLSESFDDVPYYCYIGEKHDQPVIVRKTSDILDMSTVDEDGNRLNDMPTFRGIVITPNANILGKSFDVGESLLFAIDEKWCVIKDIAKVDVLGLQSTFIDD